MKSKKTVSKMKCGRVPDGENGVNLVSGSEFAN